MYNNVHIIVRLYFSQNNPLELREISMPDNRNRKRPIQVKFFVNAGELELIKERMSTFGMDNLSAYLRKMALGCTNICKDSKEVNKNTEQRLS